MELHKKIQREHILCQQDSISNYPSSNVCPSCGNMNEKQALYCEHCGQALHNRKCPVCGNLWEEEADLCEICGTYLLKEKCSFCGSNMAEQDKYCSECGQPREGIICPDCNTLNPFGFCSHCEKPLTEHARESQMTAHHSSCYTLADTLTQELKTLQETRSFSPAVRTSEHSAIPSAPPVSRQPEKQWKIENISQNPDELIRQKEKELQEVLDKMQTPPLELAAQARNYSMAHKPAYGNLGWICNYKHHLHNNPQECACPQKGGKWVLKKDNITRQ